MIKDIIELADNKLLILYIVKKLKHPCSNNHITDIILSNNFLNYFLLQQYLIELVESNYLIIINFKNKELYKIAPLGKKVLEMFQNRISQFKIDCFNNYMSTLDKKNQVISSKVNVRANNVEITFSKNNKTILNLNLPNQSKDQIQLITQNCKDNPDHIYNLILSTITKQKNDT